VSQKDFFEQWKNYSEDLLATQGPLYEDVSSRIDGTIAGKHVLDVGCGGITNYDVSKAASVTTVDLYAPEIQNPNVESVVGSSEALPLPDDTYDVVFWQHLIHHLVVDKSGDSDPQIQNSIRETKRVLKPGGEFWVVESFCYHPFFQLQNLCFPATREVLNIIKHPWVKLVSEKHWQKMLKAEGMEVIEATALDVGDKLIILRIPMPYRLLPIQTKLIKARK